MGEMEENGEFNKKRGNMGRWRGVCEMSVEDEDDYLSRLQFGFQGFLRENKLTEPNFIDWYRQLRIVLSVEYKLVYLEQPILPAPIPAQAGQQVAPEALAAHAAWNYNMHGMRKMIKELHSMLKLHEQTLTKKDHALHVIRAGKVQKKNNKQKKPQLAAKSQNQRKGKNKLAYAPKAKIPPPPKRKNLAKDFICHQCGHTGHWKMNCPQYLVDLLKNKKLSQGASSLMRSRKLKPGALSLYIGNGQRTTVDAIESFHLCLPSGLVIVLNGCLFAPSITRGIISVSRLYDYGFVNRFMDKAISASRNNMVYFSAILMDGSRKSNREDHKMLCSDCSGEYMTQEFLDHIKEHRIIVHHTPRYTLQHNGVSERRNRTLLDMVRSMMSQTTLPKSFWDYALETAARIINMVPTKKVQKTPYEDTQRKQYVILSTTHPENKVLVAQNAKFLENSLITQEEHELGDLGEPASYKAALLDPESDKWLDAMNVEMQSMKDNEVWDLVNLPPNGKTVETFSPVVDIRAIRILIAIAAYYDYEIWKIDVKTAFLNGNLLEEVYMEHPECFVNLKYPNRVCKLKLMDLSASTPAELKRMQNVPYASAVGSIMYAVRCTRPDVAFDQNITSRFQQNPGDIKRELRVSCYTDAGYLTDVDDLKSQTGYVFILNGGAIDWKSTKQSIFVTSSIEAEYIAAYDASKEAVWVRKFISGLGVVPTIEEPVKMYCDNTRAITIAKKIGITKGARHFRTKVYYHREVIEYGDIKLENVHTYDNLAISFTKELAFPKYSEHTKNIGMLPASSLM
uniref:Retrotransposon protein, putative, Ty1-copia subclass n=1 Tax=Tanacetum cinerariifolium TaxID=118510 RepID=A0A699GLD2_TANCI|nr:hypothetical protein [Tanacetum cinerariifolium]